jgi:hypothetical protein
MSREDIYLTTWGTIQYLESWKAEDLRRFIMSEEGAESGRREDQFLGYFR